MQSSKSHILVVDDDTRIQKLLKQFLYKKNFLVSTAASVQEAEELLKSSIYDLIILDVMLPNVTGLDFAHTIRSSKNLIPIVMLTALSQPSDRIKGLESGASDYAGYSIAISITAFSIAGSTLFAIIGFLRLISYNASSPPVSYSSLNL